MAIVEIIKDIVIPLLQVVSVPAVAALSPAYKAKADKENNELKEKIRLLTEIPPAFDGLVYRDADGFPFCTCCFDNSRKRVRLNKFNSNIHGVLLVCPACKYEYHTGIYPGDPK